MKYRATSEAVKFLKQYEGHSQFVEALCNNHDRKELKKLEAKLDRAISVFLVRIFDI